MWFSSWLPKRQRSDARQRIRPPTSLRSRRTFRPRLEALEDRFLPSTLTVLNNQDSGPGSLRAEIAAAQSGDTIVFAPSLDGQTITLTSGELAISKSLNIQGPAPGQLPVTISGAGSSRVFEIDGAQTKVTLSDLAIVHGFAPADYAGGVLNYGTLTISGCTLSGNSAFEGGGIFNSGTLTVSGSTLSGNSTSNDGGGIDNQGTLTVSGSTLSGNTAGYGGGICAAYGTATVQNSTLSSNSAFAGGGIYVNGGRTLTISGSTLSGNSAFSAPNPTYPSGGGGICNGGGKLTVTGCIFSGNSAVAGGAISNFGTATVQSSTLSGNSASLEGGGIYNFGGLEVDDSVVCNNLAPTGADIFSSGKLAIHKSQVCVLVTVN